VGTRVRVSRRARPVKMPGEAPQLGRGGTRAIGASIGSHVRRSTVSLMSGTSRTRGQRPRRACIVAAGVHSRAVAEGTHIDRSGNTGEPTGGGMTRLRTPAKRNMHLDPQRWTLDPPSSRDPQEERKTDPGTARLLGRAGWEARG